MLRFQTRLLRRAAQIAGDEPALAASLGVAEEALKIWMEGKAKMPDSIFLATADLVLEDDIARASRDDVGDVRLLRVPPYRGTRKRG